MTAYADTETARRAFRSGAYDYVNKEGEFLEELRSILQRAEREGRLAAQNQRLAWKGPWEESFISSIQMRSVVASGSDSGAASDGDGAAWNSAARASETNARFDMARKHNPSRR